MRRSNSVKKAIYALVVLAVFMVFLRISRPTELTSNASVTKERVGSYQESYNAAVQEPAQAEEKAAEKNTAEPVDKFADGTEHQAKPKDAGPAAAKPGSITLVDREKPKPKPKDEGKAETDVNSEKSDYDAKKAFEGIVHSNTSPPVVIFSKSYCPHSMRAKKLLLEAHAITPTPKVVELDQIDHGVELQQYIAEITGRNTVPNILVNGISRGGASDMVELEDSLVKQFLEWSQGKFTITKVQAAVQD